MNNGDRDSRRSLTSGDLGARIESDRFTTPDISCVGASELAGRLLEDPLSLSPEELTLLCWHLSAEKHEEGCPTNDTELCALARESL